MLLPVNWLYVGGKCAPVIAPDGGSGGCNQLITCCLDSWYSGMFPPGPWCCHHACLIVRFVEPIDRSSYMQQSSDRANVMDRAAFSHPGVSGNQTAQASTEGTQLSFAEVMQLVQEGKEVPGVRKLEVKPSNRSPAPSQMERLQKPWETSSRELFKTV